ncbi:MAG TPA: hypothetical protein VMT03_08255 [Polyangia bacterium]|nr:hypothetical protein [Polyangia bacterium]
MVGALAVLLPPVGAIAATEPDFHVRLRYEVAGSVGKCWDEGEFRQSVARRVGMDPFRDGADPLVSIHVGGNPHRVNGQIEWLKTDGTRLGESTFVAEDGDCVRVLSEMSFAVSLQIELLRPHGSASAGSGAAPPPAAAGAAPPSAAVSPTATPGAAGRAPEPAPASARIEAEHASPEPPARWPMWLGVGPSLAWGTSPSPSASVRLFLGIRRNAVSTEVGVEASYPSTAVQWDGTGFRQTLIDASAAVCGHRRGLSACLLGKAGQVRVLGLGVDAPRSPTGVVAQAGVRVAATLQLGVRWFATARLDALGLLTPYTVDLNRTGVWQMPWVGILAGVDVAARFR